MFLLGLCDKNTLVPVFKPLDLLLKGPRAFLNEGFFLLGQHPLVATVSGRQVAVAPSEEPCSSGSLCAWASPSLPDSGGHLRCPRQPCFHRQLNGQSTGPKSPTPPTWAWSPSFELSKINPAPSPAQSLQGPRTAHPLVLWAALPPGPLGEHTCPGLVVGGVWRAKC